VYIKAGRRSFDKKNPAVLDQGATPTAGAMAIRQGIDLPALRRHRPYLLCRSVLYWRDYNFGPEGRNLAHAECELGIFERGPGASGESVGLILANRRHRLSGVPTSTVLLLQRGEKHVVILDKKHSEPRPYETLLAA